MSFRPDFIEYTLPGYLSVTPLGAWVFPSTFSRGLVAFGPGQAGVFEWTVDDMRECWSVLTLEELFCASIFLYNRGYRREALFWYYSAGARLDYLSRVVEDPCAKVGGVFERSGLFLSGLRPWMSGYAHFHSEVFALFLDYLPSDLGVLSWEKVYPGVSLVKEAGVAVRGVCERFLSLRPSFFEEVFLPGVLGADDRFLSLPSVDFPGGWVR